MIVERGRLYVYPECVPEAKMIQAFIIRGLQRIIMAQEWGRWAEYDDSLQVKI